MMQGETPHRHKVIAHRYHDFSMGHRVAGHESKCANFHGHNYRVHFCVEGENLDAVGRVIDFSVIKDRLCEWLEKSWDHRFLLWEQDTQGRSCIQTQDTKPLMTPREMGFVYVPFNPTAENLAKHLVEVVGPSCLKNTGVRLVKVDIEETRKCSASYELED